MKKRQHLDFSEYKKEILKDPKFKAEYDKLQPKFAAISAMIELRAKKGYGRRTLAKKLQIKWSAFIKIENAEVNPSISFLQKLAEALGKKLVIQFK